MSFKDKKGAVGSPRLSKSHTFAVRDSPQAERPQALNRASLTQYSATEPTLPPERLRAERGGDRLSTCGTPTSLKLHLEGSRPSQWSFASESAGGINFQLGNKPSCA